MPDVPAAQRRRRLSSACSATLASVLLIGGLAGCDPADPAPPPSPPPGSSPTPAASTPAPTPTPTPSPSPTSQKEKEEAAIKQAVLDYYAISNKISMDPESDPDLLRQVAAGSLLETDLGAMKEWRAKGWRSTKAVKIRNLEVRSIESRPNRATAVYCIDSTGVDVLDRDGESQVVEGRPNHFPSVATLERIDGRWMPVRERTEGDACDA